MLRSLWRTFLSIVLISNWNWFTATAAETVQTDCIARRITPCITSSAAGSEFSRHAVVERHNGNISVADNSDDSQSQHCRGEVVERNVQCTAVQRTSMRGSQRARCNLASRSHLSRLLKFSAHMAADEAPIANALAIRRATNCRAVGRHGRGNVRRASHRLP